MLGCGLLAHCGDRRTINSVMVFMPLGQGGCPTLNLTASENMFPSQKANPAFFFFIFFFFKRKKETTNQYLHREVTPNIPMMPEPCEKPPKTEIPFGFFTLTLKVGSD